MQAGNHWNFPSMYAIEVPIITGVAAPANVLGRAASIQAFIELILIFSIFPDCLE